MSSGRFNEPITWIFEGEEGQIYQIQSKSIKSQEYLSIENEDEDFNLLKYYEFEIPNMVATFVNENLSQCRQILFP